MQGLSVTYRGMQDGFNATPLKAVSEMRLNARIISIQHREGQRVNTIGAYLRSVVIADTVATDFEAVIEENGYRLPASCRMEFGGAFARCSESVADLAINGAIVILAELRATTAALQGSIEGIVAAVTNCTRHITSTTITAVAGFGAFARWWFFWPPFATAIVGGVVLMTLLSFVLVPVAFLLMVRYKPFDVQPLA